MLAGVVLFGLLGVLLWYQTVPRYAEAASHPRLPWWVLTLMFAAAEMYVVHVQVRREARAVSLSDLPLVLGLFFAAPAALVFARLAGSLTVLVAYRRQAAQKLAFNAGLFLAEVCLALTVFHALLGPAAATGLRAWIAAYVAVVISGCFSAYAVTIVIALYENHFRPLDIFDGVRSGALVAATICTIGLIAVTSLQLTASSVWLLAAAVPVLLSAYRAYASLTERHRSLERLYRFSEVVTSTPDMDAVLRSVLTQARELLRAEHAEITFASAEPDRPGTRVRLTRTEQLVRSAGDAEEESSWLWHETFTAGRPVLASRNTRDPHLRRFLKGREHRESIVVPLRGEDGVVGTIAVADRMGDVRTFHHGDVQLLETVANHAGVALRNGRLIDRLRHDALHDGLTGLPNRTLLQQRMLDALERLRMGRTAGFAVMLMDLNGFKDVNDTLGHQSGDQLLKEVANRLVAAAGPGVLVVRLGGDEFAVLMPDAARQETAVALGRRLLLALERPIRLHELELQIGAALGIALAPAHSTDASGLLKRADLAMYAAKGTDGGLRLYEPDMSTGSPQRLALVSELRQGIEAGQLTIHVQPKAELRTGKIHDVETLVRWQHPQHGLLTPDEFVPVAERSGLIRALTTAVLDASLASCAQWRAAGVSTGVAVNLSARSLADPDLAEEVARLLGKHEVPSELLTLEITESSIMTDPGRSIGLLELLSDMGIRLSVDDFGTGYSSLAYLKRLPVRQVKIDRSFVTNMDQDDEDATIVRSIVDLSANLSLEVVAEGVEDRASWDRLAEMGCDLAQGYLLSRPMPAESFLSWRADYELRRATSQHLELVGSPAGSALG